MTSLKITADLMATITEQLDRIIREPVDISSSTVADSRLISGLKVHLCIFSNNYHFNLESEIWKLNHQSLLNDPGDG